jgi:flavin reductase
MSLTPLQKPLDAAPAGRPADAMPADAAPSAAPTKLDYRNAMTRLAAAVNIITTDGVAGLAGFTASAVCSVTDEPPTLLVCLNRNASVYAAVQENAVLCVNTLAPGQQSLSNLFGGKTPTAERFAAARWRSGVTGAPLLEGAAVSFDCRVTGSAAVGSHDVLFCEVLALRVDDVAHSLIYFDRKYHEIAAVETNP